MSNFIRGYFEYSVHIVGYIYWMTDERPGIMPKSVEIYEKTSK